MRLGIVSDIHANIEALQASFEAMDAAGVERTICLDKMGGYGASPIEACSMVRSRAAHTILGNHDAAVAGRMDYSYYYHAARHALDLHAKQLQPEHMEWLLCLPFLLRVGVVLFCLGLLLFVVV